MSEKEIVRRSVICPCGSDCYDKAVSIVWHEDAETEYLPVWRCDNCNAETPRKRAQRRTNHQRAVEAYFKLVDAWKPINDALDVLIAEQKVGFGWWYLYNSCQNYSMRQLIDNETPSSYDVKYHIKKATEDLETARAAIRDGQTRLPVVFRVQQS